MTTTLFCEECPWQHPMTDVDDVDYWDVRTENTMDNHTRATHHTDFMVVEGGGKTRYV